MHPLLSRDPSRIGGYRLLARLGSGGMGEVFLARSRSGREVALKLVHADLAGDPEFRARFRREVAAARAVSGAFTAPVIDADPEAPVPWLAAAYLRGVSLQQAVSAHGPLPVTGGYALGASLAEALQAIHRAGVVHRDLKPSNVILTAEGPKVIDFGIARAAGSATVTMSGSVIGSPGFMAPEQATGLAEAGTAADVFSLGAVLAYTLTGVGPFGEGPTDVLIYRIVHDEPRLSAIGDPELRELVASCLVKEPALRPVPEQLLDRLTPHLPPATALQGTSWLPELIITSVTRRLDEPPPADGLTRRQVLVAGGGGLAAAVAAAIGIGLASGGDSGSGARAKPSAEPGGDVLWRTKVPIGGFGKTMDVAAGVVFSMGRDTGVTALDARTGKVLWRVATQPLTLPGRPLTVAVWDRVVPLRDNAVVSAYDLATGQARWTHPFTAGTQASPPLVAKGLVIVSGEKEIVAYDASRGEMRWSLKGEDHREACTVSDDVLYTWYGTTKPEVHAVDVVTGKLRWKRALVRDYRGTGGSLVKSGRFVYAPLHDGEIHALDADSGDVAWVGGPKARKFPWSPPLSVVGKHLYIGDEAGSLYAYDAGTGARRWRSRLTTAKVGSGSMAIEPEIALARETALGLVYVYDGAENLVALDASTGKVRWRQAVPYVQQDLPVVAEGAVHLASLEGVQSFHLETGQLLRKLEMEGAACLKAVDGVLYCLDDAAVVAVRTT
ncbi:PQQ-binding-like beta-propeller repeat protein [Nonomuraea sp. NPDC049486]|uniref:outer membrane protein assembly factor BamB family protein n=1 Tax=Nonomuraea sp. NPDC049486 TaxID=3155773 RepID=UPI0034201E82